jgi:catechol 2,3-dioxygenase-like lactoylglutathione lyase family enzyme
MANVGYMVGDTASAVAFYTEHLGFELKKKFGPFAMVTLGDLTLWLSGPKTSARIPMSDGREPEPGGWNRIVVEVDELGSTVERLTRSGVRFRNKIVSGVGGKQVLIEDQDGNPIELFEAAPNRPTPCRGLPRRRSLSGGGYWANLSSSSAAK